MKKFLLIGLDPESIDYSTPGVPAGMTAEKLLATIADVQKHFADQGDHLDLARFNLTVLRRRLSRHNSLTPRIVASSLEAASRNRKMLRCLSAL